MTFWDKELDETLSTLSTTEDGLSSQEAKSRLLRNGKLRPFHKVRSPLFIRHYNYYLCSLSLYLPIIQRRYHQPNG